MANTVLYKLNNQIIEKKTVKKELEGLFEYYWKVSWDVAEGNSRIQKIISEPKADIFLDNKNNDWKISEINKSVFEYNLEGKDSVFGIKLKPATQFAYLNKIIEFPKIPTDFNKATTILNDYLTKNTLEITDEMNILNSIIEYVCENRELYNVQQIISKYNISQRTLQRIFKKYIGLSLKWIIMRYRTLEAIEMAKDKKMDWNQLSYHLNYSDQSHFIRDFKRNIQLTPEEYYNIYNS